ncbi:hypothetical protein ACWGM0_01205 [Sphingomonas bisphenolicum]
MPFKRSGSIADCGRHLPLHNRIYVAMQTIRSVTKPGWVGGRRPVAIVLLRCQDQKMDIVREIVSPTGKRKIRLYQRADGFFTYDETFEAFDEIAGSYWSSGYEAGIFETEEAATADMTATTPWMRHEA